jgi:hypothetical protein
MSEAPSILFPRVIDATMRSDWHKCPHAFFRRHCQGLSRPRTNVHLHFGGCLAAGLEAARREFYASGDCSDALHLGCERIIAAWGEFTTPEHPTRTEANKTLAACLHALQSYLAEWPLDIDPFRIHTHAGQPCIEWSGAVPIPGSSHPDTGEPILYAGRFDLIGDYQHAIWGLDDKTTGIDPNNESWRQQWKLRGQFTGYAWLAREYGIPLRGFIVRGVGVLSASIRLGWALAPRPPWMIDRWLHQLQDDTEQMVQQYEYGNLDWAGPFISIVHPFPQVFDTACADFGGCSFTDLCSSEHPEDWEDQFTVQRWDPLVRQEDAT